MYSHSSFLRRTHKHTLITNTRCVSTPWYHYADVTLLVALAVWLGTPDCQVIGFDDVVVLKHCLITV